MFSVYEERLDDFFSPKRLLNNKFEQIRVFLLPAACWPAASFDLGGPNAAQARGRG